MAGSQRKTGVLLSYSSTLLHIAVNIFLTPFVISSLGDAEYGVYQMMVSFAGYLVLINFGTGNVMTRYVSMYLGKGDKRGERNYIAMCLMITGGLLLLIISAATVLYIFIDDIYAASLSPQQIEKAKQLFILVSANVAVSLVAQAFQGISTAYEKFTVIGIWNVLKTLLKVVLVVLIFFKWKNSIVIAAVDLFLSCMFALICIVYCFFRLKVRPKLYKFDKKIFASSAVFSLAIMLQAFINQVNSRVDITILGIMISPESVTRYSVAMQIFQVFSSLSTAAIGIYLPKFTKLVSSGEATGETLTREMIPPSRVQTIISGAIVFGFLVCGRDFIYMWMGEGYSLSWWIAMIIMIPTFLVYSNGIIESVLDAMQKRLVRSVVLTCVAVANIILSIFLVYYLGEIGAPIGTAVTTIIGLLIIMNIYYKKAIKIKIGMLFKGIFKGILPCLVIATAAAVPAAIFIPVSIWGLFIKGGIFIAVFGASLILFGLSKQEKAMLLNQFKRKSLNK